LVAAAATFGLLSLPACSSQPDLVAMDTGYTGADSGESTDSEDDGDESGEDTGGEDETGGTPKLDVGPDEGDECKVGGGGDIKPCSEKAPPDSFDPVLEWAFDEDPDTLEKLQSTVTPLVVNMTDDDDNGVIDLCDTPDVIFVANVGAATGTCSVYVLDGATGSVHYEIPLEEAVSCQGTPVVADIDDDGEPEIVTLFQYFDPNGPPDQLLYGTAIRLKAFETDGTYKWEASEGGRFESAYSRRSSSLAVHDLDGDGDVEFVVGSEVYDHQGKLLWDKYSAGNGQGRTSFAADLDEDGDMEVIVNNAVYHHDGTPIFEFGPTVSVVSIPQVADLDDDMEPEILFATTDGLFLIEHDGSIAWGPVTPNGVLPDSLNTWHRPATVHDFDGDGRSEFALSSATEFCVFSGPAAEDVLWCQTVDDSSGAAGSTAFDFLGDGVAEAIYADELKLRVYDGATGDLLLEEDRCSLTYTEYPVVVDVDNDDSAEILVVSNSCPNQGGDPTKPALQVFGEAESRWIQARRVWNQHAYYVTNVNEDGTVPAQTDPNWATLNTFRTNAQIEGGSVCIPPG
jgi:hypothetical protein